MIYFVCNHCRLALRTVGDQQEILSLLGAGTEWFPNKYPCPSNGCSGMMQLAEAIESTTLALLELHDLAPIECYQAFYGLGLPEERECGPDALAKVVKGRSIAQLHTEGVHNDRRTVLRWIALDDGTKIYLGSSPQGAMIYRIAPPRSVVNEVLREHD